VKKKIVYISAIAAPHQIKLCYALQEYFDAEFWFYDKLGQRASWWLIDLGDRCKVLEKVKFKSSAKYFTCSHLKKLKEFNPEIVMLGGFSVPANYLAYLWARKHKKKVIVFTERSRNKKGVLRKKTLIWALLKYLYRNVDLVMVNAEDTIPQFRDVFGFGKKVVAAQYACDIEDYLKHKPRTQKDNCTILFANRLTEIYNPILAIEVFNSLLLKYPSIKLKMNAEGELKELCIKKISEYNIQNSVEFLSEIKSWNELHLVYKNADILILPALFSNGNFTIIEAMASGMGIVISNKILGLGKLIENKINGFNCEPELNEFVIAIENYIKHPELFINHSVINKKLAQLFSAKATAELYFKLINKLYE
jgi:glycosyltransferase involved in cell wall biosynthesis